MNRKFENISKFFKTHKVVSIACTCAIVLGLGLGGFGIAHAINAKQVQDNVLAQMDEQGNLDAEAIQTLADNGQLGEEIVDPNTGETVVITQNEDGTVTKTVVSNSDGSSNSNSSSGHSHNWVAHYATGTRTVTTPVYHPAVTQQVLVHGAGYECNTCGAYIEPTHAALSAHVAQYGHGGTHSCSAKYETVTVQEAYTENVQSQEQYQYVDYYYCSECGVKQ